MSQKLKPCPFCGEEPFITAAKTAHCNVRICCNGCTAVVYSVSSSSAIKQWNDRYYPEGCTPEDAMQLREANHALAAEKETFESLLTTAMELIREKGFEDEFYIRRGKLTQ